MENYFLIVMDAANTITEQSPFIYNYQLLNDEKMQNVIKTLDKFQKNNVENFKVKICIISGYSAEGGKEIFEQLSEKHPEFMKYVDIGYFEGHRIDPKTGRIFLFRDIDKGNILDNDIIPAYGEKHIAGMAYLGDDQFDIAPLKTTRSYGNIFRFGSYPYQITTKHVFGYIPTLQNADKQTTFTEALTMISDDVEKIKQKQFGE